MNVDSINNSTNATCSGYVRLLWGRAFFQCWGHVVKLSSSLFKFLPELFCFFLHFPRMYVNCTGPGFSLHSDIVMPYIANYGSEEQIKRFIPEMAAGKCIGAIAMTEPGAGR